MKRFIGSYLLICLCIGLFLFRSQKEEYAKYYNQSIDCEIQLVSEGDVRETGTFYAGKLLAVEGEAVSISKRIRIKIRKDSENFHYGDLILATVHMKQPDTARNPGNFDYRNYLLTQRISAIGEVKSGDAVRKIGRKTECAIVALGLKINTAILNCIRELLPREKRQLAEAILAGSRQGVEEERKELFSKAGISHILSVSGVNAIFFLFPFSYVMRKGKLRKQRRYVCEILLLLFYMIITGFGVPVVRTVIMMGLKRIAFLCRRDYDKLQALLLSLTLLMLQNPYVICSLGTQLSYGAVLSMHFLSPGLRRFLDRCRFTEHLPKFLKQGVSMTLAVQTGTLPVLLQAFDMPSLIFLISNLLCGPLVEGFMMVGMLMLLLQFFGLSVFAQIFAYILCGLDGLLIRISAVIASLAPLGRLQIVSMSGITILLFYIGLWRLCAGNNTQRWYRPMLWKGILCLALLLNAISFPGQTLQIVCIDVGQGDSIFLRLPSGKAGLIDCGSSTVKEVGRNRILPFLKAMQIRKLEFLAITHFDQDHISAAEELFAGIRVKSVWIPAVCAQDGYAVRLRALSEAYSFQIRYLQPGDRIRNGEVDITCIHPEKDTKETDSNALSLVLELRYRAFSALFTGDLEGNVEQALLPKLGRYDVLKIAHHGSRNSTLEPFLQQTSPEIGMISCGERNQYGHPHKELLERIKGHIKETYITADCGAILITTKGQGRIRTEGFIKKESLEQGNFRKENAG